jgi:hypothetical protein
LIRTLFPDRKAPRVIVPCRLAKCTGPSRMATSGGVRKPLRQMRDFSRQNMVELAALGRLNSPPATDPLQSRRKSAFGMCIN